MHNVMSLRKILSAIVGILLVIAGGIHWFIIFGFFSERAPLVVDIYFNSLAVVDIVAGVGLLVSRRRWVYETIFFIGITQVLAHGYMLYIGVTEHYESGISAFDRVVEIGLAVFLIFFSGMFLELKKYYRIFRRSDR